MTCRQSARSSARIHGGIQSPRQDFRKPSGSRTWSPLAHSVGAAPYRHVPRLAFRMKSCPANSERAEDTVRGELR